MCGKHPHKQTVNRLQLFNSAKVRKGICVGVVEGGGL